MRLSAALLVASAAACAPALSAADEEMPRVAPSRPATDSIVLERTACFRSCRQYRVRLNGAGEVRFHRTGNGDTVATDRVAPAAVAALAAEAERIGLASLPARVRDVPELCGPRATDHATAIVSVHTAKGSMRVEHYLGCHGTRPELRALRGLAERIDSVAGSARWVGP